MWKKILVPLDGSESANSARDLAIDLAQKTGAELELVTVFDPLGLPIDSEHVLETAAQQCKSAGVPCTSKELTGVSVASAIIANAEKSHTEAILMGSHGRSGFAHVLFGSVAEEVLKDARCAVMIVRPARSAYAAAKPATA